MGAPPFKLVLLGDSSVGKTSLVHRFTTEDFDPYTSNTIGAAFITKEYHSATNPDKKVKFEIWDTAGQERYRSLTPMYYRNAKMALICYDLSNISESFEKSKFWIDQLRINDTSSDSLEIKIRVVGTKSDLLPNEPTPQENEEGATETNTEEDATNEELDAVNTYCLESNIPHFITSAKLGQGISELFTSIIDEIDESFWDLYNQNQLEEERIAKNGQLFGTIDFLNARFKKTETSKSCCS